MKPLLRKLKSKFFKKKSNAQQPNDFEIPSYEVKRKIIDGYREKFNLDILVETGTFLGDTVEFFKTKFKNVFSIELSEELAARAKKRFESDRNVKIIQGDSGKIFETFVQELAEPSLFWLDGHYSSEFFHNGEYIKTAKADLNTPVEKELDLLLKSKFANVILIDDARLFTGMLDYPTIEVIKNKLSGHPYSIKVETDIIHITPETN